MSQSLVRNTNIARSSTTVGHSRHAGFGFRYAQAEVRSVGYITMRDPTNWLDVVIYSRADPDRPPSKRIVKALAGLARIV
jgi:hypothetical protein